MIHTNHHAPFLLQAGVALGFFALNGCTSALNAKVSTLEKQILLLQNQQNVQTAKLEDLSESFVVLSATLEKKTPVAPAARVKSTSSSNVARREDNVSTSVPSEFLEVGVAHPPLRAKPHFTNSDLKNVKEKSASQMTEESVSSTSDQAESEAYQEAYRAFQKGDSAASELKFSEFLKKYPDHEFSDNAQYWLGEIYYKRQQFALAAEAFEKVVKVYPKGNKVPEALLKAGECYDKSFRSSDAKRVLARLITDFPSSLAAQEARGQLNRNAKE